MNFCVDVRNMKKCFRLFDGENKTNLQQFSEDEIFFFKTKSDFIIVKH